MKSRSAVVVVALMLLPAVRNEAFALAGTSAPVSPSPSTSTSPSATVKAEARNRFDLGLRLFEKGENAAALAEFKRAYDLIPNVLLLYNMGLVYAAMDRPVEATDALAKVVADSGGQLNPAQKRQAQRTHDEQAARVAEVLVVTNRPATIEIDGVEAGHTPLLRPLRLSSGAHVISAVAPGCLPSRQEVTLAGQVTGTVTLTLQPTEVSIAHVVLSVSVPGAEVLINDKLVGRTPLAASVAVPPGSARVEVRRPGYRAETRDLRLDEGANGTLNLTLEEDPTAPATLKGQLRLAISEPGSEVSIDGVAAPAAAGGDPLSVVSGPHILRIQRAGFESFEQRIEITAGRDNVLAISLVPTLETEARYQESGHSRRAVGWSLVAGGALLGIGAVVYAVLTRHAVSDAQAHLDAQLALEQMPAEHCYAGPNPLNVGYYMFFNCAATKAALQDDVDAAKLRRIFGYGAIGLGAVVAGVGTYLVAASSSDRRRNLAAPQISIWNDGQGGGLMAFGRF